jgi:hypothetical protein
MYDTFSIINTTEIYFINDLKYKETKKQKDDNYLQEKLHPNKLNNFSISYSYIS